MNDAAQLWAEQVDGGGKGQDDDDSHCQDD